MISYNSNESALTVDAASLRLLVLNTVAPVLQRAKDTKEPEIASTMSEIIANSYSVRYEICDISDIRRLWVDLTKEQELNPFGPVFIITECSQRFYAQIANLDKSAYPKFCNGIANAILACFSADPANVTITSEMAKDLTEPKHKRAIESYFVNNPWFLLLACIKLSGVFMYDVDRFIDNGGLLIGFFNKDRE